MWARVRGRFARETPKTNPPARTNMIYRDCGRDLSAPACRAVNRHRWCSSDPRTDVCVWPRTFVISIEHNVFSHLLWLLFRSTTRYAARIYRSKRPGFQSNRKPGFTVSLGVPYVTAGTPRKYYRNASVRKFRNLSKFSI